jgi:hypothetical protein
MELQTVKIGKEKLIASGASMDGIIYWQVCHVGDITRALT